MNERASNEPTKKQSSKETGEKLLEEKEVVVTKEKVANTFFEKSKVIANDYIQSIVFLDDRAYKNIDSEDTNHDFDISEITKAFAKENKICAAYKPESEPDISDFISIANKADIIVLDWQIEFIKPLQAGSEEEDEPDDPRGHYTKEVIESVLFDDAKPKNSLKLIVVYTGDYTVLKDICEDIYKNVFKSSKDYKYDDTNYSIHNSQIKVLVRAKHVQTGYEQNKGIYEKYMIKYNDLPEVILHEFTLMTSGLLTNFALLSLTTLRNSSNKILGLFSSELDTAFLGHKAIIPKQEDAEDLLIELFGDTVKDLLYYVDVNLEIRENLIDDWIDNSILEEDFIHEGNTFKKTKNILKEFIHSKEENVQSRFNSILNTINKTLKNHLYKNSTLLFANNSDISKTVDRDKGFAKLTHHKSLFIPRNTAPKLTLGTLIKSTKSDNYFICIQQKCDSVRIPKDTERKFLFIPLTLSSDKFDLITDNGLGLKKDNNSYSIRTIKFVCADDTGIILAKKNTNGKFVFNQKFTSSEDEQYEWILDLKDLHSQRIVIDYTSRLSRVGLDESEWHRRNLS